MKRADELRAPNRSLINNLFNGLPPYTKQEEDDNHILVNVNWKEGTNLLHDVRRQFENAFLKPGNRFTVHLQDAPSAKSRQWSAAITKHINRPVTRSLPFMEGYRSKFAGVSLHGVGPQIWDDPWKWVPYNFGIEDLMVPTDTYTSLENLFYFAVRRPMKPGDLYRRTFGREKQYRDKGWDMKVVASILDCYKNLNQNPHQWNWSENPEKMAELFKQNNTYFDGDSAPMIYFWEFYFQQEEDDGGKWARRLIMDKSYVPPGLSVVNVPQTFVYENDEFASEIGEILHIQFGDGNNKPPFMYHSVRSIGWILYDVVNMMNRLRCQFTEHVFEQMMMLLNVQDPNDRSRVEKILLMNKGIMPEGVNIVPAASRYAVDNQLVQTLMSNYRQLMSEQTAAYTQDLDSGTEKEKTATQVMAEVNSLNALTSSIINYAYLREAFAYREICRRFCLKDSPESDVKKFRRSCIEDGVPEEYLDVARWDVQPERVLGGGNKSLEVAQATQLMQIAPQLDPDAQREARRIYISAVTDDEKLAQRLVPENAKSMVTDAMHDAELAFGTLMQGVPMRVRQSFNHEDQIETLLRLMVGVIKRIEKTDNTGTPGDIIGLQNVAQYIVQHIQILSQDKQQKAKVRQYSQMLGKIMNYVKAFAQRQQQAAKAQQQNMNPEAIAKAQSTMMMERVKAAAKEQQNTQKLRHKELDFRSSQRRKNAETQADIQRMAALTGSQITADHLEGANRRKLAAFNEE